jgi:acyl-CoA synthetase (AMP-forming)/AMP-acid ligase II
MVQMIRNYYPVFVIGIPTQILKMLKEDLGGIGSIFYTGAASLAPEIQDRYEEQTGGGLGTGGMGLSECSPVTHLNYSFVYRLLGGKYITRLVSEIVKTTNRNLLQMPRVTTFIENLLTSFGPKNIGMLTSRIIPLISRSVAKLPFSKKQEVRRTVGIPLQDMEMRVIDVDTGKKLSLDELEDDKRGEMIIKGVNRMLGYWPEEGKGLDEEGYIHTGDVVRVDKNGYFYVVDRTKDIINVSGLKVYSEEMDDLLYGHPGVEFAATIGVPDRERPGSERVKVYIELKPDYKGKTNEQEIIDFLRDRVPKYAVPTYVEFIDQIPLTDVQKVDKKAIRNIEAKKQRVI